MRARLFALGVEAVALALVVHAIIHVTVPGVDQLVLAGLLAGVAVAHVELSRTAERVRRRISDTTHVNMTSVCTFAAALLLPVVPATVVVVVIYTHLYLRVCRPAGIAAHRHLFSATTVVLAVHAVAAVSGLPGDPLGGFGSFGDATLILAAVAAFTAVNMLLVVTAVRLSQPGTRFLRILLGGEIVLELATVSLGGLVAVIIANTTPWLVLLAIPPLLVLEQATLVRQLETRAETDAKTGLLNNDAWRWRARQMVERSARSDRAVAVLVLDLDHFKAVNDRHGHLAGDDVLRAVAGVLTAEVRDQDPAGRFGGEEFVVAIGGLQRDDVVYGRAREVAERIRRNIEALVVTPPSAGRPVDGLSVSIGVAASPDHGDDIEALLTAADAALYAAKRAGRNQVRVWGDPEPAAPAPATPPFGMRYSA
ncbi:GGDEF domain-containing protein [Pseudonocardia nematodicida]|uniref:GGDEF domain-containing protein n=1 Tax=Pseudonocardia nematodicida TaxID=1206997 RepID=A0ABV1K6E4_9PSEU